MDNQLRKLERAAQDWQDEAAVEAYWRACFRAGEFPKPQVTIEDSNSTALRWRLGQEIVEHFTFKAAPQFYVSRYASTPLFEGWRSIYSGFNPEAALDEVKQELLHVLSLRKNPPRRAKRNKRRNADDRLRRLERAAASGNSSDLLSYWKECLRLGQLPPTNRWGGWYIDLKNYVTTYPSGTITQGVEVVQGGTPMVRGALFGQGEGEALARFLKLQLGWLIEGYQDA